MVSPISNGLGERSPLLTAYLPDPGVHTGFSFVPVGHSSNPEELRAMKEAFRAIANPRESHMEPPAMCEDMAMPDLVSWFAGITTRYMRRQMVPVMDARG